MPCRRFIFFLLLSAGLASSVSAEVELRALKTRHYQIHTDLDVDLAVESIEHPDRYPLKARTH